MASSMPGLGAPQAQAVENHPEQAVRQPAGPDGTHEQRLERDEAIGTGGSSSSSNNSAGIPSASVQPVMIPTQRNTSRFGADNASSGDDTLNEKAVGKNPSASSSQDYVGEMGGHVSVRRGKEEFAALERKYSNMSQNSLGRATSRRSVLSRSRSQAPSAKDIEKQQQEEAENFDLAQTLRSGRQAQDEAGIKRKAVGVAWDGLEVVGAGGMKINIRTFPNAIAEQFMMPVIKVMGLFGYNPFAGKPKTIIFPNSGVLKPGEMCLVLGRPGAGCSTFLKTIANQRDGYESVNGDVSYAGVGFKEMRKRYAGEVVYSPEDDDHLPTLTVSQTIRFALATKTPNKRIDGVSDKQFQDDVHDLLLSMLNIKHTTNTIVGNQFVRGVSGGERKRVSIAEMFCAGPVVASWDNSTRGLDASTALDYAKSLRLLTDIMQQTTFVSLYQAGEGIYDQFDKVLVLNDGHVVYYGPTKEARPYMLSLGFRDLPRQTTADYLTGCTDVNERQFADGRDASNVPSTPEDMEKAFIASDIHRREQNAKSEYQELHANDAGARDEFRAAVQDQKHRGVSKKSPYTVSFLKQVVIITKRQTTLKFQDKFGIYTGYATSIAIALIVGSLFFQLPSTAAGIFTRGGLLFIGLLFPALNAFSELPGQMMGRPILIRQSGYKFFRPAAFAVAAVLSDIPYNLSSIFLFSIILYFMGGLYASAGAYFTYLLLTFVTFLTMASFFRTLGVGTKDYNVAARLASVLISIMVTYTGYMIPVFAMKRWLFWLFYLNPLGYGYSAIFANEFHRVDFTCDGNYLLPRNIPEAGITGFNENGVGENQLCSVPGSVPGQNIISGDDYMAAAFEYSYSYVWRNFGILLGFLTFFIILQMILVERMAASAAQASIVVFKKEDKESKELNARLAERREDFNAGKLEQDVSGLGMAPTAFTWSRLSYTVPIKGGQRQLLNDVWGYVKPGTLTALMGASGAGKTTLLDVLADRKTTGVISGEINMGGKPIDSSFQRGCGYAEQQDVHEWTATVREALRFSAYLRQPQSVSVEEKNAYCEDIIELLELQDLADAMIGFPGFGLSVEARKRVTIGVELAAKPDLLLFLDEPTSGLDGQSAYNVVRFLQKLCDAGQKILCTIHQPNALLFQSFHRLLLLQRGGECVYFGDIGHDAKVLASYLERNGAPVPGDINVAEYMLEAIGAGSRKRIGGDWGEKWRNSPEFKDVQAEVEKLNKEGAMTKDESNRSGDYATSFWFQLKTVLHRTNIALWRNADYQWTRLFAHIAIALVVGLTFLQLDNSLRSLQYRVFAIFFTSILPALILAQIEPQYLMSRMTFVREASSKMYSSTIFASTQLLAEMPYSVLCATAFFLLLWYTVGLPSESGRAGVFFALVLITEIYSVTLGQLVAALSPTIIFAALWNPFILVVFTSFAGVVSPPAALPYFWRSWLYPLNPFSRLISASVSTALYNVPVICEQAEYNLFSAPAGQTCAEYAGAFAEAVGGYLGNPSAVGEQCEFCQYSVGQSFYAPLSIDFALRGRDIGIYICYIVFNSACLLLAARFLSYTKR